MLLEEAHTFLFQLFLLVFRARPQACKTPPAPFPIREPQEGEEFHDECREECRMGITATPEEVSRQPEDLGERFSILQHLEE
jgi:hypothetical protein